jgi:uncharacterized protein YegJ (DUF2314 family)
MEYRTPNALCGVYKITNNINGKVYIGQSINIKERWNDHIKSLNRKDSHSILLQRAWNKYKQENFSFEILELCPENELDNVEVKDIQGQGFHIGYFSNNYPIVATCLSWTKALNEYSNLSLGNIEDRQGGHNSKTSPIFVYQTENDERTMKVSPISVYNNLWEDNPLFFISNDETKIRTIIAKERFHYLKELADDPSNEILLKIALPIPNSTQREHIYFRLVTFKGDKFEAVLLQDPYSDIPMKPGDSAIFSLSDVSDWTVYTSEGTISPSRVYLLEK